MPFIRNPFWWTDSSRKQAAICQQSVSVIYDTRFALRHKSDSGAVCYALCFRYGLRGEGIGHSQVKIEQSSEPTNAHPGQMDRWHTQLADSVYLFFTDQRNLHHSES